MSDQISEKMARRVYEIFCVPKNQYSGGADGFVARLRSADLIKPSKLDEARVWCDSVRGTIVHDGEYDDGYRTGVLAAEARFEAAITEILEERE